jgi:hypothetical protein
VRTIWVTALAAAVLAGAGCRISRNIRDLEPPDQPPLQLLESHLDYVDPDDGRPDYIVR